MSPVSEPFPVSSDQLPAALAASPAGVVAGFRLVGVSVHVPLESGLKDELRFIRSKEDLVFPLVRPEEYCEPMCSDSVCKDRIDETKIEIG